MTDLLWAWRSLRRSPGLTIAAVLTCMLGVGANIALLSVVDRLMFRPLPYAEPHRLVQLHDRTMAVANPFASLPQLVGREIKERSSSFDDIAHASVAMSPRVVAGLGDAPVVLASGSDNLLPLLGVRLLLGDHPAGTNPRRRGPHPLLLTADTWRTRFGGRADVLGTPLASEEGITYEVAGVLPPDFLLPSSDFAERIAGLIIQTNRLDEPPSPGQLIVAPVARLRSGVSLAQAQAEVDVVYAQVPPPAAGTRAVRVVVQPLQQGLYFLYGPQLRLVVLAGAIVLLLACVNLSALLLARNRWAERSTAIRLALGASSRRVFAASAFEALLVCAAGGALAIVACLWARHLLLSVVPPIFRGFAVSALDLRLLAAALATTVLMAVAISLAPTWRALRVDAGKALQAGGRSGEGRLRGGSSLLAVQAALGVALVAGAMLTVGSYLRLVLLDTGFVEEDLYVLDVGHGYDPARPQDNATVRAREVIEIAESMPGVAAVGVVSRRPFGGFGLAAGTWEQWGHSGGTWGFSSGAFAAMGLSLRSGRTFLTTRWPRGRSWPC